MAIVPGILWVYYFYRKDKYDPEPAHLIVRDFIWGMLAVIPASLLEYPFASLLRPGVPLLILLFASIFIIGLIEESLKSAVVYFLHFNHPDFNEPIDGIIYGITVGLGFASLENLVYTYFFGIQVGITRAVLTSLVHAAFTGYFGYFLSKAKTTGDNSYIFSGLALVVLLHGLYDFLILAELVGMSLIVLMVVVLQIYLAMLIKKNTANSPFRK